MNIGLTQQEIQEEEVEVVQQEVIEVRMYAI
jgi:hypothetical protein